MRRCQFESVAAQRHLSPRERRPSVAGRKTMPHISVKYIFHCSQRDALTGRPLRTRPQALDYLLPGCDSFIVRRSSKKSCRMSDSFFSL